MSLPRDPDKLKAWQQRSRGINPMSDRRRKPLPKVGPGKRRTKPAEQAFRSALQERNHGFCEVQTPACPPYRHNGHDPHHLWTSDRDRGIHDPARGLWVCRLGHDWIGLHPDLAREQGWYKRDGDR